MYFEKSRLGNTDWWRYFVNYIIVSICYLLLGTFPLMAVISIKKLQGFPVDAQRYFATMDSSAIGISQNFALILLLFPAVFSFVVLFFGIMKLHMRTPGQIISAYGKIRYKRILFGALLWLVMLVTGELIMLVVHPANYLFHFQPSKFIGLLIISIFLIPLQAWFEELFFRGYLMQSIASRIPYRWVAIGLTATAFGMLHLSNPEVEKFGFWSTMPFYIGFGLFVGLVVFFDGGLELAFGIHAANNFYGTALVNFEGSVLQTPSLFKMKQLDVLVMNFGFVLMAVLFMLIAAKKFKWKNSSNLYSRIQFTTEN